MDRIRKLTDQCDNFQGFMMYHSINGGTGSGLGTLLLQRLSVEYNKKTKINYAIFPSAQISTNIVETYNAVLSLH